MKIYLSGGITGLTLEESSEWRKQVKNELKGLVEIFDPTMYYNYDTKTEFDSEREVRDFELYHLRNSDIVIVNFNAPNSLGTCAELTLANEYRIPVIGLNENKNQLHPWLTECVNKMFYKMDTLIEYIKFYYIERIL